MKIFDLRSDTITVPTEGMRRAIYEAEVGDDVYAEDPSVNRLQEKGAAIVGKEVAIFVPTGSMGNLIPIFLLCGKGNELIAHRKAHILHYEMGSLAAISGSMPVPADGERGKQKNVALACAVREAVGAEADIMFDAWNSWDVRYAIDMANRLAEFNPRWIEEVVKPDDIPGYARVRSASQVPISGGEHEYTRWGARDYFTAGAVDVYQADTYWAGGISEMMKIFAMASAFEVHVIPHGHSVPTNAHLTAAQSPGVTPFIEFLIQWNGVHQFFLKNPVEPVDGQITVSDLPGLGLEIDESKVENRQILEWD